MFTFKHPLTEVFTMITLIQTEFIKLKHSKIFLLTVLGALSIPALLYIALLTGEYATFQGLLDYCATYACALFYIIIFTIIIAYLFGREYTEHTLKTVLTAPLSKTKLLFGKYLMFFIWTFIITTITFTGTVLAAYFGGISDITLSAGLNSYKEMLISVFLLCLSFSPFVFLSLVMPNMVFSMVTGAIFSIINLFVYSIYSIYSMVQSLSDRIK